MSDNARRAAIIGGVLVILIAAFVVFRPSDDEDGTAATPAADQTATPTPTAPSDDSTASATATPTATPEPAYDIIRVRALKPVGGVKKLEYEKGDTIRIKVRSDREEQAHLHGFDISKPVGPGKTATYNFRAKLEGVFELELENSAVPIAELTVSP